MLIQSTNISLCSGRVNRSPNSMMIVPARSLIGISDGYPGSDFIENKSKAAYFNKQCYRGPVGAMI